MDDINIGSMVLEEELELGKLELEDEVSVGELELDYIKEDPVDDYEKLKNLPSINNVLLKGNLTSEDLGITDIELIGEIKPESIEEDLKPNQVYNGNAIHDLARLFGMTIEELTKTLPNIIQEFDIDLEAKPEDVYNVIAIHQLMEIFGFEIMQIQEAVENKEDKQVYIELNLNFNPSTASVSIRDWITENPYQVADIVNKKGKTVVAKGHLYNGGTYLETVFLTQTLYSDSSFGKFKYFLGFTDDITMAYLRINSNGTSICGLKRFE